MLCLSSAASAAVIPDGEAEPGPDTLKVVRRASVWTLVPPLGLHRPAEFDTLPYNYQRQAVPSFQSDAYATTGNLGGEGQNQIFFQRRER